MATIWFTRAGEEQRGWSIAEKSIDWCVEKLGLNKAQWIADLSMRKLTIGEKDPTSPFREQLVVVEVKDADCHDPFADWRPGYYLLEKRAGEVQTIIGGKP